MNLHTMDTNNQDPIDVAADERQLEKSEDLNFLISQSPSQTQKRQNEIPIKQDLSESAGETVETIKDDGCEVEILSVSPSKYQLSAGWKVYSHSRKDGKPYHIFESPSGKKYQSYKAISQELSRIRLQGTTEILDCDNDTFEEVKLIPPKKELKKEPIVKSKYFEENSEDQNGENSPCEEPLTTKKRKRPKEYETQSKSKSTPPIRYEVVELFDETPSISESNMLQAPQVQQIQIHSIVRNTTDDIAATPQPKRKPVKLKTEKSPKEKSQKPETHKQSKQITRRDFILPPGWREEVVYRKGGATQGRPDYYWYNPAGKKFRSLKEIERYFESLGLPFPSRQGSQPQTQNEAPQEAVPTAVVENSMDEFAATLETITNINNNNNNSDMTNNNTYTSTPFQDTVESQGQIQSQDLNFLDNATAQQIYANDIGHPQDITDDLGAPFVNDLEFQVQDAPVQESQEFVVVMHHESASESSEGAANSDVQISQVSEDNRSSDSNPQFLASDADGADE